MLMHSVISDFVMRAESVLQAIFMKLQNGIKKRRSKNIHEHYFALVTAIALAIRIGANQTANAADRVRQQNLSRRALYIAIGATSGRHNKIGRRAINRAPLLTGLVFAILAAVRLT